MHNMIRINGRDIIMDGFLYDLLKDLIVQLILLAIMWLIKKNNTERHIKKILITII
jgi:hypothetical protein